MAYLLELKSLTKVVKADEWIPSICDSLAGSWHNLYFPRAELVPEQRVREVATFFLWSVCWDCAWMDFFKANIPEIAGYYFGLQLMCSKLREMSVKDVKGTDFALMDDVLQQIKKHYSRELRTIGRQPFEMIHISDDLLLYGILYEPSAPLTGDGIEIDRLREGAVITMLARAFNALNRTISRGMSNLEAQLVEQLRHTVDLMVSVFQIWNSYLCFVGRGEHIYILIPASVFAEIRWRQGNVPKALKHHNCDEIDDIQIVCKDQASNILLRLRKRTPLSIAPEIVASLSKEEHSGDVLSDARFRKALVRDILDDEFLGIDEWEKEIALAYILAYPERPRARLTRGIHRSLSDDDLASQILVRNQSLSDDDLRLRREDRKKVGRRSFGDKIDNESLLDRSNFLAPLPPQKTSSKRHQDH